MGVEPRGQVIRGLFVQSTGMSGRSCVSELTSSGKPFEISKREVWEAYERVKANKGAPGVDGCSIEEFEADLKNNFTVSRASASPNATKPGAVVGGDPVP